MGIANYVQEGDQIDYTPVAAATAGDVIDCGTWVAIWLHDCDAGVMGHPAAQGVFDVNKYSGEAIAFGAKVYWDVATATATGTIGYSEATMGLCVKDAATNDAKVRVLLTPGAA